MSVLRVAAEYGETSGRSLACTSGASRADKLPATLWVLRQAGAVPTSPECLDQLDGGDHSPAENVYRSDFVREGRTLRDGDFQVTGNAALVSLLRKLQGFLGGKDGFVLSSRFVFQNAQCSQIVFHLLETGKHGSPIPGHLLVVHGNGLI